jgi:hypothetical protein
LAKSTAELNLSGDGGLSLAMYPDVETDPQPATTNAIPIKKTLDMKDEIFCI